ncbi:MAG: tRNA (adenosine(37)-N6)-threonylcarbamoyltransferase complex dimerization subunit type 1 TsaB, partial [Pararhizobium sp.]
AGVELAAIGRIAVTVGPGSFTGIRVGVATARALALALASEAVGISTLEAIGAPAATVSGSPVLAVIDAKRNEVYAQLIGADGEPASVPAALEPSAAATLAAKAGAALAGSGVDSVAAAAASGAILPILTRQSVADIAAVARRAARLTGPFDKPKPLYLRGADAKPQAGFAVARKVAAAR